jgi:VIT1/CCC1 family predicted Fe2+/Mn2+ transporter
MLPAAAHGRQNHRTQSQIDAAAQMGVTAMSKKEEMAIAIALQTQVLKTCPIHNQVYCCDDEEGGDDENMARAFAVAVDLVRQHKPYAEVFHHDAHELTDLLSYTIGAAPFCCPDCMKAREPVSRRMEHRAAAP